MESDICVLTNGIPPIHFLFLPLCYCDNETRECTVDYIISCFPNNAAVYHDGKLPLHQACEVRASQYALNKIFNIYPNVITQKLQTIMIQHCIAICHLQNQQTKK